MTFTDLQYFCIYRAIAISSDYSPIILNSPADFKNIRSMGTVIATTTTNIINTAQMVITVFPKNGVVTVLK